jgi:hypothetical protein
MKMLYYLFMSLSLLLLGGSSCAHKTTFLTSTVVPAAEGTIKWKKDANDNYVITIKMVNLAEVERLQPPKKAYVVWLENQEGRPKNLGQINSMHETFSKKLKATFETVSAFKPTKIYITAEEEANVNYPSSMVVLQSKYIR